jgi:hypothetical protein
MGDFFSSLSNNSTGIILGIVAYFLGILSDLVASTIYSYYSSGHITVKNKRTGWVIRFILWAKNKSQSVLERWFSNKNQHVCGVHFLYRLEMMPDQTYAWKYSEIDLSINLSNEIQGKHDYTSTEASVTSSIQGNFVLDKMMILFISDQNILNDDSSDKMIAVPDFKDDTFNLGWVVNSVVEDKTPFPAVIKREMLNFPQQLLKDDRIKNICKNFPGTINWTNFKNETE